MSHLASRPPYLQDVPKPQSYYRLVELPSHQFISYCATSPRKHPNKLPTLRSKPNCKNQETQTPAKFLNMTSSSFNKSQNYSKYKSATTTASALPAKPTTNQSASKKRARSAYYERAKSGFVYWPVERKPLTHNLKRPFGSVGAVI